MLYRSREACRGIRVKTVLQQFGDIERLVSLRDSLGEVSLLLIKTRMA